MKNESGMILSIPQLRLCIDTLTGKQWDDLPLLDTGEPVEQRLMNAFMKLIQAGYFLPDTDAFTPTAQLAETIVHISEAERVFQLWEDERIAAFFYEKAEGTVEISPDVGNPEHCRITYHTGTTAEAVKEQYAEPEKLCLKPVLQRGIAQYDLEKLALFFGERKETEEAP